MDMYTTVGDQESVKNTNEELETLERECISVQNRALEYLDSRTTELMENHVHRHLESLQEEA